MDKYGNNLLNEYNEQIMSELTAEEIVQQSTYIFYDVYEVSLSGNDGCDCFLCGCVECALGLAVLGGCFVCFSMACAESAGFDSSEMDLSCVGDTLNGCLDCCCY